MRVSYRWLRELLPALDATPSEVADRLTRAGLEVEGVDSLGEAWHASPSRRYAAWSLTRRANRLRLVTVDTGSDEQRIVLRLRRTSPIRAARRLRSGGSRLPAAGLTIEPRAIAGVDSAGMLCSEAELGLSDDSDGIIVLGERTAKPGALLSDVVPESNDTVFTVGITPNRPRRARPPRHRERPRRSPPLAVRTPKGDGAPARVEAHRGEPATRRRGGAGSVPI